MNPVRTLARDGVDGRAIDAGPQRPQNKLGDTTLLVGKEATTPNPPTRLGRPKPGVGFAAALCLLFPGLAILVPWTQANPLSETVRQANVREVSGEPVQVSGGTIHRWQIGSADASLLTGDCTVQHDGQRFIADAVLMVVDGKVGDVRCRMVIDGVRQPNQPTPLAMTIHSLVDPQISAPIFRGAPAETPSLMRYLPGQVDSPSAIAMPGDAPRIQQVQFAETLPPPVGTTATPELLPPGSPALSSPALSSPAPISPAPVIGDPPITFSDGSGSRNFNFTVGGGTRSIRIEPRNPSAPPNIKTIDRIDQNETVYIANGGVTVSIADVQASLPSGVVMDLGTIRLSADRVVAWSPLLSGLFNNPNGFSQAQGELYLEGDIVFEQGERTIYAQSMYFNTTAETAIVLDAEAITTIPDIQGYVRLKSKVLQQINRGNFRAFDAAVTTSRMGVPRYWLQSEQLALTDRQRMVVDPSTGSRTVTNDPFVESNNNFVYAGGVPIFYWPTFSTSLTQPTYYLSGASVGNDSNFGTQVLLDFDLFQLFGIENAPRGANWELSTDYLSDRGPALGTSLDYRIPGLLGYSGPVVGNLDVWGIHDTGLDNLGGDRRNLDPETTLRGRGLLRHRHYLPNDYELIAEVGYLSDRNFLEQYFENEWDQDVDHRTALRLRKYYYSNLFDLSVQARVNDFFSETQRLPELEHYLIGGSLLGDRLTYSAHNAVSYSDLSVADLPENAAEAAEYSPLPGEGSASGVIARTRQEIALPVQLGAVKFVPNVLGEAAHYGEAADGESLTRLFGQAGVRASLPMWTVDPTIQSSLLNVRGLAHKIEWTAEYSFADSDTNLDELPYYDPLDDNSQEQFRRRFIQDTYGGVLPERFDPRNYAFRHGIQNLVASPSDDVADDLQRFQLGVNQRWQTKRGLPGRERIVDLFQFDVDLTLFPDADRDNFGETLGPARYDMRYHVGDRVTLLSDGYVDFFDDGLRSVSAGVRSSRPGVGDLYVGLLSLEGPISSTVLRASVDYRMNEKWIASAGTTYDFGEIGNVGQAFALTRIGESFLLQLGVNIDPGRDNVGFRFGIEPRFWPSSKLARIGDQLIPPPGVLGFE